MNEKKNKETTIKLGLLGDDSVGKTSICKVLIGSQFRQDEIATIGTDKYEIKFKLENDKVIKGIIYDTVGQERFRTITLKSIRSAKGIILVFDVTSRNSFDNIEKWLEEIKQYFEQPYLILFGNKVDIDKKEWKVIDEEIKSLAQKYNLKYFLTSAKTKMNITEGFDYLVNISFTKVKEKNDIIDLNNINEHKQGCIGKEKKRIIITKK